MDPYSSGGRPDLDEVRERLLLAGMITPEEYCEMSGFALSGFATDKWRKREAELARSRVQAARAMAAAEGYLDFASPSFALDLYNALHDLSQATKP